MKSKWIVYEVANTEEEQPIAWQCPECGEVVSVEYNYCPECGLDMFEKNNRALSSVGEKGTCGSCEVKGMPNWINDPDYYKALIEKQIKQGFKGAKQPIW